MSLIETVMTALGGEFTTVKTNRSSYQTNGVHTVRGLRNNNVQIELHDLKTGNGLDFIQKGRMGAQAYRALTEAGIPEADISVSNGSYDNRGGQQGNWKAWPSLYVSNGTTATKTAEETTERINKLEGMLATALAALEQKTSTPAPTPDKDGDGPVSKTETDIDF